MTTTQIVVLAVVVTVLVTAVLLVAGAVWLRRGGQLGRFGAEEQTQDSDRILESNQVATVGQMLHLVIQSSPTGIVVVDRNGDVMLSNARAHDMALVHARTINPQVWRVAANVFDDEEKENRYLELSVPKHRTGNRISNVRALVKPLTLVDDRFMIVYGTDESENVRMQSARRDFVANVSHELKTPVGGMALLAEALLGSPDDPEHVTHFGRQLQREANRMADMVNELISLSKLQGAEALPEIAPVSVAEVISAAIARNQVAAENHGIILRNLGAARGASGATGGDATSDGATGGAESNSGLFVVGNRNLLVTAVSNLVSNAINYSPDSTPVTVSYEAVSAEEICIHVVDQGIGIASEDQERVFERFFRVDKARSRQTGGTGLGLAIVKHVVANHGGNIRLFSELGEGTTFTLALPRYQGDGMGGHGLENHDLENLEDLEGLDNWGTPENPEGLPVREKPEEP
ncbi:ATP-binding protein [Corynebacterium pseudodiphtheriticum]|uniref:ATP-binding protein n=1 Tax=Corynebacterium pseudodiphtheriticum TaxID=37637 RepID=UPI003D2FBCA9